MVGGSWKPIAEKKTPSKGGTKHASSSRARSTSPARRSPLNTSQMSQSSKKQAHSGPPIGPQIHIVYPKTIVAEKNPTNASGIAGRPEWRVECMADVAIPPSKTDKTISPEHSVEDRSSLPEFKVARDQRQKIKEFMQDVSKRRQEEHVRRLEREKRMEILREKQEAEAKKAEEQRIAEAEFNKRKEAAAALEKERQKEEAHQQALAIEKMKAVAAGKKPPKPDDPVDIGDGFLPYASGQGKASFSRTLGFDTKRM